MKTLYSEEDYLKAKTNSKLPLECYFCKKTFFKLKNDIRKVINKSDSRVSCKFCSKQCYNQSKITKIEVSCKQCEKVFLKTKSQIKENSNNFCSRSCSVTYNNCHKTKGFRRSKLEIWLEEQLQILYPKLNILLNEKSTINSELDIYLPTLKLAFELNGIFHYEPIYGAKKLEQIQNNDNRKFQACLTNNIELCIIDTSSLSYFKPNKAQKYLEIICKIINQKIL